MPKSKKQLAGKDAQDGHFHWEFLRRSGKYRNAYEEFAAAYPGWIQAGMDPRWPYLEAERRGEDVANPTRMSFTSIAYGTRQTFEGKWGIGPTHPDARFSPFLMRRTISVIDYGPATAHWASDPHVLTLCISTRAPLRNLMEQLEWRLRHHKSEMEKFEHGKPQQRKRFDKFQDYIAAFDLRSKRKTYREIADKLRLDDEKTAYEYTKRAEELIGRAECSEW